MTESEFERICEVLEDIEGKVGQLRQRIQYDLELRSDVSRPDKDENDQESPSETNPPSTDDSVGDNR